MGGGEENIIHTKQKQGGVQANFHINSLRSFRKSSFSVCFRFTGPEINPVCCNAQCTMQTPEKSLQREGAQHGLPTIRVKPPTYGWF